MRKSESRPFWTVPPVIPVLALIPALALAACGDFWRNVPSRPAATDDPAVAATPYPSVNSVPTRPQLSYPLQQRREIAVGLVADRANARYAGDALRRENDRPVLADRPPPLPPAATATQASGATPNQQGELALAYVEEALARDDDNGSLDDFLDRLQQPPIGPGPRSAERAAAAAAAKKAQEGRAGRGAPAVAPAPPSTDAVAPDDQQQPAAKPPEAAADSVPMPIEPAAGSVEAPPVDTIEVTVETADVPAETAELPIETADVPAETAELPIETADVPAETAELPIETADVPAETATAARVAPAAAPATTTDAAPTATAAAPTSTEAPVVDAAVAPRLPLAILFAAGDAAIAVRDTAKLEALAHANSDTPQLFVVGNGPRPGLAMERARGVAALLVNAGMPVERLIIEMGGESDVVVVYEPDGDTG